MNANRHYPVSFTLLAGLAGAIAWGFPFLISPFVHLIPFLPDFPEYYSPPIHVPLARLTFSYALAAIIAGSLFLSGLRFLPADRGSYSRPTLSLAIVLATLAGMTIGDGLAILVGLLMSSSPRGVILADSLGFGFLSAEPYLSIGLVSGTALATIIIGSFSGIMKQLGSASDSPLQRALKIALRVSLIALVIRSAVCFVEVQYLSFAISRLALPTDIFILLQVVSGAAFGIYTWNYCSKLKAA